MGWWVGKVALGVSLGIKQGLRFVLQSPLIPGYSLLGRGRGWGQGGARAVPVLGKILTQP